MSEISGVGPQGIPPQQPKEEKQLTVEDVGQIASKYIDLIAAEVAMRKKGKEHG